MKNYKAITKLSRVYYQPGVQTLQIGKIIEIEDPTLLHYLKNVIRLKAGSQIRLFNEKDGEYIGQLAGLEGSNTGKSRIKRNFESLHFEILTKTRDIPTHPVPSSSHSSLHRHEIEVELLFSPIRKENMKLVFEKGTELGITRFLPIITKNCQHERLFQSSHDDLTNKSSLKKGKTGEDVEVTKDIQSFHNIIIQSCEQSERLTIPKLLPMKTLSQFIAERNQLPPQLNQHLFICKERSSQSPPLLCSLEKLFHKFQTEKSFPKPIVLSILIGPEGGFQDDEFELLSPIGQSISLGENILKAETAAITAVSAVQLFLDSFLLRKDTEE